MRHARPPLATARRAKAAYLAAGGARLEEHGRGQQAEEQRYDRGGLAAPRRVRRAREEGRVVVAPDVAEGGEAEAAAALRRESRLEHVREHKHNAAL